MAEQKTEDKLLSDYLAGKSGLSGLYQQIPADNPNATTDELILAAARGKGRTEQKVLPLRHLRWTIPVAIAAMLIISVSVLWWQYAEPPQLIDSKQSAAPPHETTLPQEIDSKLHENAAAEQWLEKILKLHLAGHHEQASEEYKKFRQLYPAYSIDAERFGTLQIYDK